MMAINRTIKSAMIVLVLAFSHLVFSRLIVALTLALPGVAGPQDWFAKWTISLLVRLTRILYFPIISLSLYSRNWFPGDWIWLPMAANSILWAMVIFILFRLLKRRKSRRSFPTKGF